MRHALISGFRVAALAFVPALSESRLTSAWRKLIHDLFDRYRPELHYMRGPGPKWRAKHGTTASR
jgi:hypothetical protein